MPKAVGDFVEIARYGYVILSPTIFYKKIYILKLRLTPTQAKEFMKKISFHQKRAPLLININRLFLFQISYVSDIVNKSIRKKISVHLYDCCMHQGAPLYTSV